MEAVVLETSEAIDTAKRLVDSLAPGDSVELGVKVGEREREILSLGSEVSDVLMRVLGMLASGGRIAFVSAPEVLSTTEAARMLGISRPTLMKLVREGKIPAFKVGTHTRLQRDAVLRFRDEREQTRRKALESLHALDDELLATVDASTE